MQGGWEDLSLREQKLVLAQVMQQRLFWAKPNHTFWGMQGGWEAIFSIFPAHSWLQDLLRQCNQQEQACSTANVRLHAVGEHQTFML
jgi:hypothetical protein